MKQTFKKKLRMEPVTVKLEPDFFNQLELEASNINVPLSTHIRHLLHRVEEVEKELIQTLGEKAQPDLALIECENENLSSASLEDSSIIESIAPNNKKQYQFYQPSSKS